MLELKNIVKRYESGETAVMALSGVSLCFRENEFVSILGPSGCGKTTLLNIVGGLDRYSEGDLIINGRSTKSYRDSDWDTYRNHSIGFVFQSYNLIPHQTVLANVELALTLSGVSKTERRKRAIDALKKVGLEDQIHKKPNQMSGGQMQRVAIARALVNDPDILLADEPTGALDTQTSVQIMDLLKEVADDRLVIMVTHNPELAEQYSTRIVNLSDGLVVGDSNPISDEEYQELKAKDEATAIALSKEKKARKAAEKKTSMSFSTAVSLSLKNLLTKKGRTILTSFAGSIGIIGIALILALSNGIQLFIDQVQEDTLSTYPLSIYSETQDMSAMLSAMTDTTDQIENPDPNTIYVDNSLGKMMSALNATVSNNLVDFKTHIDKNYDKLKDKVSDIQYTYDFDLQVYTADGKIKLGMASVLSHMGESFSGLGDMMESSGMASGMGIMSEMINNQELLDQQYEKVAGDWPKSANDVVLVVGENNQISKLTLYMLGVLPQENLEQELKDVLANKEPEPMKPYPVSDFIGMKFNLLTTEDFFEKGTLTYKVDKDGKITSEDTGKTYPVWNDKRDFMTDDQLASFVKEKGIELNISGIIRPRVDATATSISGAIGYTKALTDFLLEETGKSEVIKQQKETDKVNVLTGRPFEKTVYTKENIHELIRTIDSATMDTIYAMMTEEAKKTYEEKPPITDNTTFMMFLSFMPAEQKAATINAMLDAAGQMNPMNLPTLYAALTATLDGMTIDSNEDIIRFLPIMSQEEYGMLMGTLLAMCDPQDPANPSTTPGPVLQGLYDRMNAAIMEMKVDEQTFMVLLQAMNDEQFATAQETLYKMAPQTDATLDSTLKLLGDAEKAAPASINFYAKDFNSKEEIELFIKEYNDSVDEKDKLEYTDIIGIMMSSVSIIINVISYVLIAFVSISLVVSSIMIGIITNISVLERTKEIGILRAIGASKKDISRVFNAETFIIGVASGFIGIVFTLLLCLPVNAIIQALSGFSNIKAVLPLVGAVALIVISMILTIFAGLIPAKSASKKDPVVALRSE